MGSLGEGRRERRRRSLVVRWAPRTGRWMSSFPSHMSGMPARLTRRCSRSEPASGQHKGALDRLQTGGAPVPGRALVGRIVDASVRGAERGEGAIGQRVQAVGVDVILEPLGKPGAATLEGAAVEVPPRGSSRLHYALQLPSSPSRARLAPGRINGGARRPLPTMRSVGETCWASHPRVLRGGRMPDRSFRAPHHRGTLAGRSVKVALGRTRGYAEGHASASKGPDDGREAAPALAGGPHGAARSRAQGNAPRVGRAGRGGRPGRRSARATRIPPGRCGSPASHPSEPRGAERSAVKSARDPLRFPAAGCMFGSGTGAARAGSATSGQSPLTGITRAPKSCRQRLGPESPDGASRHSVAGREAGRRGRCICAVTSEGAAPKDRPPLFPRAGSKSWAGSPRRPPGDLRDVRRMQEPLDVRVPGRPPSSPRLHLVRVRPSASRRSVEWSKVIRSAPGRSFWRR
jgi:hypothetical protein